MLVVLDGWGVSQRAEGNATVEANLPNFRWLNHHYPSTTLNASGEAVGLPEGQMGNSEVGHLNIGAGRIVYQEFTRISRAIKDGSFFVNPVLLGAVAQARKGHALHLMGLVSPGGVHSHSQHLYALLELARQNGLKRVYVHAFLDGRDVPPASAQEYLADLEATCKNLGVGRIATVMGRYYAMDRDRRWERTARAYRAMVLGEGERATSAEAAVSQAYARGVTDEFVEPTVIIDGEEGQPVGLVAPEDAVIFFNFRADRARQLTRAFVDDDFQGFERPRGKLGVHFVCFTEYDVTIKAPVAFPPQELTNTFGQVIANRGLRQLRIAETEKYAHVTFFFNGGVEEPNPGEDRVLIPSPKVATYDLKPEMSAYQVTEEVLRRLDSRQYQVVILNFANPDMVGHTGVMKAAVQAIEAVDNCLGRIAEKVRQLGGSLLITGDHGNVEQMLEEDTGQPHTAHTTNPVPFILVDDELREAGVSLRSGGALRDIAPTMLELLDIPKPAEMSGVSLLVPAEVVEDKVEGESTASQEYRLPAD
ncbi:MAG: 2,3-bisphosphoglycerate-independent phosphoglycerate mutase [Clostridia bacterium]|nr:2,3-bisphosphoglycerate-independent phosphoglycerate mutase [Clostridia bacterium]